EAPADPRPAALEADHAQLAVLVVREVVAVVLDGLTCLVEPVRRLHLAPRGLTQFELTEDRRSAEVLATAVRAGRHLIALVKCDREAARPAPEAPCASERSRAEAVQGCLAAHRADDNDLNRIFGKRSGRPRAINPQFAAHLSGGGGKHPGRTNRGPCQETSPASSA